MYGDMMDATHQGQLTRYITGKQFGCVCEFGVICSSAKNFRMLLVHYVFMNKRLSAVYTHTDKGDTALYMHLRLLLIITHTLGSNYYLNKTSRRCV